MGVTHQCGALEYFGVHGQIQTKFCDGFSKLAPTHCGCTSPATPPPTAIPFASLSPATSLGYPICCICGSCKEHVAASKLSHFASVGSFGLHLCAELEYAGLRGFINSSLCSSFAALKVPYQCGCTSQAYPPPTAPHTLAATPPPTQLGTFLETSPPTAAPLHLTTVAPAPSPGFPICYICGSSKEHSTKPSQIVHLGGVQVTCGKLEYAALHGSIQPAFCPTLAVFKIPYKSGCAAI